MIWNDMRKKAMVTIQPIIKTGKIGFWNFEKYFWNNILELAEKKFPMIKIIETKIAGWNGKKSENAIETVRLLTKIAKAETALKKIRVKR